MFYDNVAAAENDCEEEVTTCRVVTSQDQDNLLCRARGGCWLAGPRWTEDEIANVQYWPHLKLDSV